MTGMSNSHAELTPTEIRTQVLRNGYTPLPNVDKQCFLKGWSTVEVTEETIESWGRIRRYKSTGLRIENGLCAIDLDIPTTQERFDELVDLLFETFPVLQDAIFRAGKGTKEAWFVRVDEPFGRIAGPTYVEPGGDPEKGMMIETFGGLSNRQFGAIGWHTKDELRYEWLDDRSPLNVPLDELPLISKQDVFDIVRTVNVWLDSWAKMFSDTNAGEREPEHVYDLHDELIFTTQHHGEVGLDELRQIGEGYCSASFTGSDLARNPRRCTVSIDHEGGVAVWDSMTGTTHHETAYQPRDRQEAMREAADRLRELGAALPEPEPIVRGGNIRPPYMMTEDGAIRQNEANLEIWLDHDPDWIGVFSYSEFDGYIWIMRPMPDERPGLPVPRTITDADELHVQIMAQHDVFPSITIAKIHTAITCVAQSAPHHAPRDLIESFEWDGTDRVSQVPETILGCEGTPVQMRFFAAAFRKWMISAVARVMDPGCKVDHVLVLDGGQGPGKTEFFQTLAMHADWHGDDCPPLGSKAAKEWLPGKWIAELGELSALSGSEIEHVKSMITTRIDSYRPAYGRRVVKTPRQSVFAGTTNDKKYLTDPTGNRRFWPVPVGDRIDTAALRDIREQLWAEALVAYRAGERWWFDKVEDAELLLQAQEAQEDARVVDPMEEEVRAALRKVSDERVEPLLTRDIADLVYGTGAWLSQSHRIRWSLSRAIQSAGWVKGPRSKQGYSYIRGPKADPYEPQNAPGSKAQKAAQKLGISVVQGSKNGDENG